MKRSGLSMAAMVATVVMVLTVSTYAITARAVNPVVGLSFQGTTAVCHAKCFAGSDSDNIQATLLPNIRHQPPNISDVLLLPPIANASGAVIVSTARITYLSAISSKSLNTLNMIIRPKMITSSQAALREPNAPSSKSVTSIASGISKSSMILAVRLSPTSQICGLAISRKANTKVLVNNNLGSSPSKPRPTAILLRA